MEARIAIAKVGKYASSGSGDTIEIIERPRGGISVVLADGQSSGRGAKWISTLVVRKVISLLSEGVRDGAAARAASDSLFTERDGKVSAALNILSVDMLSRTLVITRNNPAPALLAHGDQITRFDDYVHPVGLYRDTRPVITEVPIERNLTALVFSDGLVHAGSRTGSSMDVEACLQDMLRQGISDPQYIADSLLEQAVRLDQGRPVDDISVAVLCITPLQGDDVRRMSARLPLGF